MEKTQVELKRELRETKQRVTELEWQVHALELDVIGVARTAADIWDAQLEARKKKAGERP